MKNRLFVLIENLHNEAILNKNIFDGKKWQIVTTGFEIKPVFSSG